MLHDTTLRGTGLAISPHLYAPEKDFDPASVALKFARQVHRENATKALGWSPREFQTFNAAALAEIDQDFATAKALCGGDEAAALRLIGFPSDCAGRA
ncbi:hypothetical protein DLJ53_18170 [Acuticoccus sediminis]|uniref:Uncharacterized protein n=1 Tax=Acuticoccus sediminis TaxID=2184697 RepID=A0A8B2NVE9_9HYPH|nr:hypothetical protein [Acuticoccus sediminis]RAI01143.1 hypothetical protein DLJ53_18170 [Acuticoccus sediminis]